MGWGEKIFKVTTSVSKRSKCWAYFCSRRGEMCNACCQIIKWDTCFMSGLLARVEYDILHSVLVYYTAGIKTASYSAGQLLKKTLLLFWPMRIKCPPESRTHIFAWPPSFWRWFSLWSLIRQRHATFSSWPLKNYCKTLWDHFLVWILTPPHNHRIPNDVIMINGSIN